MEYRKLRLIEKLRRTKIYQPGMHKTLPKRLNWDQIEARPQKEKKSVVKGTSKRVVVVRSPDPKVFEEAIFIVKEDFLGRGERTNALKEAQEVANAYIRGAVEKPDRRIRISSMIWGVIGAIISAGVLLLIFYF